MVRPPSCGLESETAGLRSLWLAIQLKPWLRTTGGLGRLMAARWLTDANRKISRRKLDTKVDSHINLSDLGLCQMSQSRCRYITYFPKFKQVM